MGREIRNVPPNYVHPVWTAQDAPNRGWVGNERSFHDEHITTALADWLDEFDRFRRGDLTDFEREYYSGEAALAFWMEDNRPPDPEYCRPWRDEEASWFQVWETVSEGSPVSPPFATEDELVEYLAVHGDFWDQKRAKEGRLGVSPGVSNPGWGIDAARAFVKAGSAPSLAIMGGRIIESKDIALEMGKEGT